MILILMELKFIDRNPSEWKWKDHTVHMVTEPLNVKDLLKKSSDVDENLME